MFNVYLSFLHRMLYKNIYYTDCKLLNTLGRRDSEAGDPMIICTVQVHGVSVRTNVSQLYH